jgi:uncharacterized RDD family membrane protein YckC
MNCQNCDAPVGPADEWCEKCGAKLLRQRVFLGVSKPEDFALTPEESRDPLADDEKAGGGDRQEFPARPRQAFRGLGFPPEFGQPRWGGFIRRAAAFLVDGAAILLLAALMGAMSYVGYKVGLSAHNRAMTWNNAAPLMSLLTLAWIALATLYFVVLHGMGGKTVGKWLFGLRLVGMNQRPVSYRRALLRWVGTVGLGGASLGLAFLWILWQREKRGWHDLLARTWVVRD